jgi:hypothetical protein
MSYIGNREHIDVCVDAMIMEMQFRFVLKEHVNMVVPRPWKTVPFEYMISRDQYLMVAIWLSSSSLYSLQRRGRGCLICLHGNPLIHASGW